MSQKDPEWVEGSRESRKRVSELGQLEKGLGAGGLKGGEWRRDALSAATVDLGNSYFAAGDRLSTLQSFTSPLETHFIDFSIFLLWLLSHPTTHFPRAPCFSGESSRGPPAPPSSTPGWSDRSKRFRGAFWHSETIPLALSVALM